MRYYVDIFLGINTLSTFFITYMAIWGTACFIAVGLMLRLRANLDLFQKEYWLGLFQGWKVTTFVIAAFGMTIIAPYTNDPTWDYVDALFMSILAYTTAPWVLGSLYLAIVGKRSFTIAYIASCIWMFSASWSYDLYLVIRDGEYPVTWLANIGASSLLYVSAGMFWSLEYVKGRGVIFGFMDANWPSIPSTSSFTKVMWYAIPLMLVVVVMIYPFLI